MGGGGSGRRVREEELKKLAEKAKEALREAAKPDKRNVFISFAEEDLDEVNLLRGQPKNELSELDFNDWSLSEPFDSKNAEYIRRGIRERIKQSSVTLCYISESAAESKWVDWEIRESKKLGKGVIAVYKGPKPPRKLPPTVSEFGVPLVPWKHKELMRAIEAAALEP